MGAFKTGVYRNYFAELGIPQEEIEKKLEDCFQTFFYGSEEERIYHETEDGMGYLVDTGNLDVRTEGMSYGMMMCVQLNKKEEFDRIWRWVRTYMYLDERYYNKGYYAWSCGLDGTKNSEGPAPDGEEFFAMALFFASHRWGDGEGIYNYSQCAKDLLHEMVHKEDDGKGEAMFDPKSGMIRFITCVNFTDPSYHLPHFYELFALWANEEDRPFFQKAAKISRDYLTIACHEQTGLCAEYAHYDGTPVTDGEWGGHSHYYSDSYRTVANIGLDYEWFGADERETQIAANVQKFFCETHAGEPFKIYEIDGTVIDKPALHPVAILATNAQASLASRGPYADACVKTFWETPLRTGERRYYDNCLYLFALLALSGNYRIW